jgi:hypothetical protein
MTDAHVDDVCEIIGQALDDVKAGK